MFDIRWKDLLCIVITCTETPRDDFNTHSGMVNGPSTCGPNSL